MVDRAVFFRSTLDTVASWRLVEAETCPRFSSICSGVSGAELRVKCEGDVGLGPGEEAVR